MIRIENKRFKLNDDLLKCELFKYLNEDMKDENIEISNEYEKVFKCIYKGEIVAYADHLLSSLKVLILSNGILNEYNYNNSYKKFTDDINTLHDHLCYFGHLEYIEILYKTTYECLYDIERKKIARLLRRNVNKIGRGGDLCVNENLDDEFFETYPDIINYSRICQNKNISEEFLERHINFIDWQVLCKYCQHESFFERHIDKVIWSSLSRNPSISEEFFERHINKVNWESLSRNPGMSVEFFERHIDKVVWHQSNIYAYCTYLNQSLTEEFFERHIDKVSWTEITRNPNISESFIERNIDKIDHITIPTNCKYSKEFVIRHIHKFNWYQLSLFYPNEELFELNLDKVHFTNLSQNTNISESFFERHLDKIDWYYLSQNINMSEAFLEKHIKKISWYSVSFNKCISPDFIEKYQENIRWEHVSLNQFSVYKDNQLKKINMFKYDKQWKKYIEKEQKNIDFW